MKLRESRSRKVFKAVNMIFILTVCAMIAVPLWMVVITSLSPDKLAAEKGFVLIPEAIDFSSYIR